MCSLCTQTRQSQYRKQDYDCQEHEDRVCLALPAPSIELGFLVVIAGIVAHARSILIFASAIQDVNAGKATFERVSTVTDPVLVVLVITI